MDAEYPEVQSSAGGPFYGHFVARIVSGRGSVLDRFCLELEDWVRSGMNRLELEDWVSRVILILGLVSPQCSTCSQIITNTHAIPKTPDLVRWVEF